MKTAESELTTSGRGTTCLTEKWSTRFVSRTRTNLSIKKWSNTIRSRTNQVRIKTAAKSEYHPHLKSILSHQSRQLKWGMHCWTRPSSIRSSRSSRVWMKHSTRHLWEVHRKLSTLRSSDPTHVRVTSGRRGTTTLLWSNTYSRTLWGLGLRWARPRRNLRILWTVRVTSSSSMSWWRKWARNKKTLLRRRTSVLEIRKIQFSEKRSSDKTPQFAKL